MESFWLAVKINVYYMTVYCLHFISQLGTVEFNRSTSFNIVGFAFNHLNARIALNFCQITIFMCVLSWHKVQAQFEQNKFIIEAQLISDAISINFIH